MELFHVQTSQKIPLSQGIQTIKIGKFIDLEPQNTTQNINLINVPNSDIVSRLHLYIYSSLNSKGIKRFEIEDQNSSNGTFLNGQQLVAFQRYPLKHGDCINLGKEGKVTLIFRQETTAETIHRIEESVDRFEQTELPQTALEIESEKAFQGIKKSENTLFSVEKLKENIPPRASHFLGIIFLVAGIIYFSSIMRVGISFNAYVLIIWALGGYLLFQKNMPKEWGWLLIGVGILIMLTQGRVYAFANLLELVISFGLLWLSYFFFDHSEKS